MVARLILVLFASCAIAHPRRTPLKNAAMPPSCEYHNYCFDKSEDYPEELIQEMLVQLSPKLVEGGSTMGNRDGIDRPNDDCERQINFDPIYEIVDVNGNVRYVIQSAKIFLQKIRTESCVHPGRIEYSNIFTSRELKLWNLACEEKRIEYWFLVLSLDGTKFENVRVKGGLPVCCSCQLKNYNK